MRLVTFARAMAPHGPGDTRLVSDDVARRLDRDGALSASEPWPAKAAAAAAQKPRRPILSVGRNAGQLDLREAQDRES